MRKGNPKDTFPAKDDWKTPIPLESVRISHEDVKESKVLSLISLVVVITRIVGVLQFSVLVYLAVFPCAGEMESLEALFSGDFCRLVVTIYASIFSGCIALLDTEWSFMQGVNALLESYFVRGGYLLFCGSLQLLLVENCSSSSIVRGRTSSAADMATKFLDMANAIAIAMNALGVIYIALSLCCVLSFKQQSLANIRKKKQALLQERKLRQHKSEVELLLLETEKRVSAL